MEQVKQVRRVIHEALALLPANMGRPAAVCIQLAIAGQEADFHHRWQVIDRRRPEVRGPARGLWQFERGGGVRGVLTHPATREHAYRICRLRGVEPGAAAVHPALESDDLLAAAFARLLMWTDAYRLPVLGDEEGAWQMYLRTWRPGAYERVTQTERALLRRKWAGYYAQALREVTQ